MSTTRTGNIQTEKTATGVITTAEERVTNSKGKPYTRWVQIGYTSIGYSETTEKFYVDGPTGQKLAAQGEY